MPGTRGTGGERRGGGWAALGGRGAAAASRERGVWRRGPRGDWVAQIVVAAGGVSSSRSAANETGSEMPLRGGSAIRPEETSTAIVEIQVWVFITIAITN